MGANERSLIDMIKPTFAVSLGLVIFLAWPLTFFILFYGSNLARSILITVLIYQYFFARKSELYRRFLIWMRGPEYFDKVDLILEENLKDSKSLICHHPHGILCFGFALSVPFNAILYKTFHAASQVMLNLPLSGIFAKWLGFVGVDYNTFKTTMKKGKNIRFLPGGFEEATLTDSRKDRVYIKERKGFIKYALRYGYTLYPSYTFNENKIFNTINILEGFRLWLNKFKIPGTICYSKYGMLPNPHVELITYIGKGIELPTIEKPTQEEIDLYHEKYVEALKALYLRYREKYGASEELEIL